MKNKFLLAIIFLATLVRFWNLGDFPALNADEAAIGYNAYSLVETGLDEHSNPWPVHFQSFNDFKPGLYFYLVLPFVKVFGLSVWSVRIPGALLAVLTVYLVYLLAKELFKNERVSFFSALFLAISPWHIHFSRGGWEVNTATFLITLGLYAFVRGIGQKNKKLIIISAISFVLSMYTYHAARIVVPLLGLGAKLIYKKEIKQNVKSVLVAAGIGVVLLLPLGLDLAKGSVFSRAAGVGLFADPGPINRINELRGEHEGFSSMAATLQHNKVVNYGLAFLENWSAHFNGEFLFLSGDDIQRNKVPETGQLYLFDIMLIVAGLIWISRNLDKGAKLTIWWLVVAPTAAALTFQSPHALRAQNMVIPLVLISALGLNFLIKSVSSARGNLRLVFYLVTGVFIFWNFARYEQMYWKHMAKEYSFSSQYGVEELVDYIGQNEEKYEKIVVTDRYDQPYILFLFYLKYPAGEFQNDHVLTPRDAYGFSTVRDFGKFTFISIGNWDEIRNSYPSALIVGTDEEIPDEANIVKEIYGINGYKYFDVVAN